MLGRRAAGHPQRETAARASVRILLDPDEAQADKDRRARHLNVVVFPALRAAGVQVLIAIVLLHEYMLQPDFAVSDYVWLIALLEAYAVLSWIALRAWYGRLAVDVGLCMLFADLIPFMLVIYATGGAASWVYALLLIRVADQIPAGYRRVLVFAHIVPLLYLLLVAYMGLVEGREFSWPIELAKPFFLYCFGMYLSTTAKAAEALRERMAAAVRVARESIRALEDKGRELESQSRELEDTGRKAAQANAAKSAFLSRASHELRTPLNAVLGFAQLLELEPLTPEQRGQVTQIVHGGLHLRELLDDLLDLNGIESGHLPLATGPVPIGAVVHEVLRLLLPYAEEHGVQFRTEISLEDERAVLADRRRLKQVLLNLVTNGIKYNRLGGWVAIRCEAMPAGHLRVSVSDSGAGIPAERLAQLYRPFERLGAEQTGVEGTGLGLALSKALITAMKGEIGVDSELGRGSTFWIQLPATEATARWSVTHSSPANADVGHQGEATVLYIEDHAANVTLVERILARRAGTRMFSAATGSNGLLLARQHLPDLILLDLNLPDMSGAKVLATLRADDATADTPIVIVSAEAASDRAERLIAEGARAYITKPFDVRTFLHTVETCLADRARSLHAVVS